MMLDFFFFFFFSSRRRHTRCSRDWSSDVCSSDLNAFIVDGNDHDYNGGAGPAAPVPGIATRSDANTQETLHSLSQQQLDNVQGHGYSNGPRSSRASPPSPPPRASPR